MGAGTEHGAIRSAAAASDRLYRAADLGVSAAGMSRLEREGALERVIPGVHVGAKGASICWTEENAEGLLHLRAHAKSGRWSELEAAVLTTTGWRPKCRQPKRTQVA